VTKLQIYWILSKIVCPLLLSTFKGVYTIPEILLLGFNLKNITVIYMPTINDA